MTDTTRILCPEVRFKTKLLDPVTLQAMTADLAALHDAEDGDAIGFAIGHGTGRGHPGGAVSGCLCAFLGTGDGRTCDGRAFRMPLEAQQVIDMVVRNWVNRPGLARAVQQEFGFPDGSSETIHFRGFTVAMSFGAGDGPATRVACPQILMDRPRSADEARQHIAAIKALFRFLGEWHTILSPYRIDLSKVEELFAEA